MELLWRHNAVPAVLALLLLPLAALPADACTSYMVAAGASADGSIIIAVRHPSTQRISMPVGLGKSVQASS